MCLSLIFSLMTILTNDYSSPYFRDTDIKMHTEQRANKLGHDRFTFGSRYARV
jgi:hypothetical protein